MTLLKTLVEYIYENNGRCALAEGANGYLKDNLIISGFNSMLRHYGVNVIDIDYVNRQSFLAMQKYSPFQFYINGGLSYNEKIGEFNLVKHTLETMR